MNFGWNIREGTHAYRDGSTAGLTEPVLEYSHDDGRCSISGGYVYRGTKIPDLRGTYLYSDNCDGKIRGTPIGAGVQTEEIDFGLRGAPACPASARTTPSELYVLSLTDGVLPHRPRLTARPTGSLLLGAGATITPGDPCGSRSTAACRGERRPSPG